MVNASANRHGAVAIVDRDMHIEKIIATGNAGEFDFVVAASAITDSINHVIIFENESIVSEYGLASSNGIGMARQKFIRKPLGAAMKNNGYVVQWLPTHPGSAARI